MKRTVKPIEMEELSNYWRRCEGKFTGDWYKKAIKYAEKNGGTHQVIHWTSYITLTAK
jgi:hypothetical protein